MAALQSASNMYKDCAGRALRPCPGRSRRRLKALAKALAADTASPKGRLLWEPASPPRPAPDRARLQDRDECGVHAPGVDYSDLFQSIPEWLWKIGDTRRSSP